MAFSLYWYFYVRNHPEEHPSVNAAELQVIAGERFERNARHSARQPAPWGKLLRNKSVWGLLVGYFCQGYPIYFYYTWLFILPGESPRLDGRAGRNLGHTSLPVDSPAGAVWGCLF